MGFSRGLSLKVISVLFSLGCLESNLESSTATFEATFDIIFKATKTKKRLKKRLPLLGFEPGTFRFRAKYLDHYTTW